MPGLDPGIHAVTFLIVRRSIDRNRNGMDPMIKSWDDDSVCDSGYVPLPCPPGLARKRRSRDPVTTVLRRGIRLMPRILDPSLCWDDKGECVSSAVLASVIPHTAARRRGIGALIGTDTTGAAIAEGNSKSPAKQAGSDDRSSQRHSIHLSVRAGRGPGKSRSFTDRCSMLQGLF